MRGDVFFAELAKRAPFTKLHPQVAAFFKDYFAHEKVVRFGERFVVNTHFPPYPSPAFDNLVANFAQVGDAQSRRLYSVTWAVTNRCPLNCWHCYNAGRSQTDLPLKIARRLVGELQAFGTVMVTLTGGEPLLRGDLEALARRFDERTCLTLGTTGLGLTIERARRLREAGVFGVGISLDSLHADEHDRLRGESGAFRAALDALASARQAGLYPYVVSVATREFLRRRHFLPFLRLAGQAGALEVHLLEPGATGRLAHRMDVLLTSAERRAIFDYQKEVAADEGLPILSSYAYLESADAFGCGAGLTHLYIDGSGEVCPCQLVPLSFGNVAAEPLMSSLERMAQHFRQPRTACAGRLLAGHGGAGPWPTQPDVSRAICERSLPREHAVPTFFRVRVAAREAVGAEELRAAYDRVRDDYDKFWLSEAGRPVDELVQKLRWRGDERVLEAGCGTGYATALLVRKAASVVAVDLSAGMLARARQRLRAADHDNVQFVVGDALQLLAQAEPFDVVFSSWVLGYIPLKPFFAAAARALAPGGRLAFVVHKENSPREPLEILAELVAQDPSVLQKRVAFDFPRDTEQVGAELAAAGLAPVEVGEGVVVFRYRRAEDVLEHLLKSGAGTAFYDALDPDWRTNLTGEFLQRLASRNADRGSYEVRHEYVACIARAAHRACGRPRR